MTEGKLVNNGLIVGGRLIVHTPTSIYNFKSTLINEIFYDASHILILELPPVMEVSRFHLNKPRNALLITQSTSQPKG